MERREGEARREERMGDVRRSEERRGRERRESKGRGEVGRGGERRESKGRGEERRGEVGRGGERRDSKGRGGEERRGRERRESKGRGEVMRGPRGEHSLTDGIGPSASLSASGLSSVCRMSVWVFMCGWVRERGRKGSGLCPLRDNKHICEGLFEHKMCLCVCT